MMYDYQCQICEEIKEFEFSMSDYPQEIICDCGGTMKKIFSLNTTGFILRGDGWTSKNIKEKGVQLEKRKDAGKRMALKQEIPTITPNYNGEVCSTWNEAKKLASKNGLDVTNYDKKVENLETQNKKLKEKATKMIRKEI